MTIFYVKKQKNQLCSSEILVKAVLKNLGLELSFSHLENKAPVLLDEKGNESDMKLSISDTKNYIFAAFSKNFIGIDAEENKRQIKPSSIKALHFQEQKYLSGLESSSSEWNEEFLHIWTCKESYMKILRKGLALGSSRFSVLDENLNYVKKINMPGEKEAFLYSPKTNLPVIFSICLFEEEKNFIFTELSLDFSPKISAAEKAIQLLSLQDYSEKKLAKTLENKGYSEKEAALVSSDMTKKGFINEKMLCENLVRKALEKCDGNLKIKKTLEEKGLLEEDIVNCIETLTQSEYPKEEERALLLAKTLVKKEKLDEKEKASLGRKLSSRGYFPSTIWKVLEDFSD